MRSRRSTSASGRSGDELVGIYGLAPAPRLQVEVASFLNEAYAQEEPLQELLVKHRRLAMQCLPLRLRLGVMRQLAVQDPHNLVWADDLHAFEKSRFRQIQVEAAEAARLNDPVHMARLLAEIQQQTWLEPPPKLPSRAWRRPTRSSAASRPAPPWPTWTPDSTRPSPPGTPSAAGSCQ